MRNDEDEQIAPAACPSCGGTLKKMPARKTKCPHCGQYMFVKASPADRTRRLVTEAQAQAIEQEWSAGYERQRIADVAGMFGWPTDMTAEALENALLAAVNDEQDRRTAMLAALQLSRVTDDPTQNGVWWRWYYAHQLMDMASRGVTHVEIRVPRDGCAGCQQVAGARMMIRAALEQMTPSPSCRAMETGRVCCAFWSASLDGNPDALR